MFERFTDAARRVVVLAQEESKRLNHSYLGTEHILLALLHDSDGGAAEILAGMNIGLDDVRRQVEETIERGREAPPGHIPFTTRAKKVLEMSLREAVELGQSSIDTEHLLLALLREGEGVAAQVLAKFGASLSGARRHVAERSATYPQPAASSPRAPSDVPSEVPVVERLVHLEAALDQIVERLDAIERRLD